MHWSARLEFVPIRLHDGRELVTLQDASEYLLDQPESEAVHIAAGELLKAARSPNQFTLHCARQAVSRAVHGDLRRDPVRRETWKTRRKAGRHRAP